jgi:hypothetical protein
VRGKAGRGRKSAPSTATIPVQATSTGAISANQFTGWTHSAGTIFSRTAYGVTAKYFTFPQGTVDAQTRAVSRDHEVVFWASIGRVYLRLVDGKALRFEPNVINGSWSVIACNVGTSGYESDTLIAAIGSGSAPSGWNGSDTDGDEWTFGVSGFDVYVKWNGVEQWREKQIYCHKPGKVGLRTENESGAFGFRSVTVNFLASAALYSTPEFDILDVRDFGMKSLAAVGSMTAASTTLTLTSNPGFAIGDKIIVETGGESGGGLYGSRGVGGQWPVLTYANATAMNADTSQITNKMAGLLDTGIVYKWNGSAWTQFKTLPSYHQKLQPRALQATITNVSGTTLTLDTAATVSTTSANVYFDNTEKYAEVLGFSYQGIGAADYVAGKTIEWPAGNFAFDGASPGNNVYTMMFYLANWTIRGQGKTQTSLFSPLGSFTLRLAFEGTTDALMHDIAVRSNLDWDGGFYGAVDASTDEPLQGGGPTFRWNLAPGSTVRDAKFINTPHGFSYSSDCLGENLEIVQETGFMEYYGWTCYASDSQRVTYRNITMDGPWMFGGFEFFRCTDNCLLDGLVSTNTIHAVNSSKDWTYTNFDATIEAGAADDARLAHFLTGAPFLVIGANIDNSSGTATAGTGTLSNFRLVQEGYADGVDFVFQPIVIDDGQFSISVLGEYPAKPVTQPAGYIEFPDPGFSGEGSGINAGTSQYTTIRGVRVVGGVDSWQAIRLTGANGTVEDCVADSILNSGSGSSSSGNITNAAYEAL